MNIDIAINNLKDELIHLRREFHMYPEIGYQEFRTSKNIEEYLNKLGIKTSRINGTGIVGLIKGKEGGKTILLRADIDALKQEESSTHSYVSKHKGIMHACGHDGHTAMLMVAAKILVTMIDKFKGNVKLVFQPNEEQAGALNMINEGILNFPTVDAAFGIHLWTPLETGKVGISSGPVMGANEEFEIEILGKSGHTSAPHTAVDSILTAATVIQNLQSLQTREIDPLYPFSLMVGAIEGGSTYNVVADKTRLKGTIRFMFEDEINEKERVLKKFTRIVKRSCEALGSESNITFIPSNMSVLNNRETTDLVKVVGNDVFGEENVIEYKCLAGEDFSEFTQRVPSTFYFVGTGNKEKRSNYPHHHSKFNIDEDSLISGVKMHILTALKYLESDL